METGFNGMLSGFPEVLSCSVLRPNKEYILKPKHGILNKYLHPNGQERIFPIIAF
jgi:hypothetical protein